MCLSQSKVWRYSFTTLAPSGLWSPETNNVLFFTSSFSFPDLISCNLARLCIFWIPFSILVSSIPRFKVLIVAIAVDIFSNWNWPRTFGKGSYKPPNLSS